MSKNTGKPISQEAANFLAFLRNKNSPQNIPSNIQAQKMDEEKVENEIQKIVHEFDHEMQSESVMEAEELFGKLAPEHSSEIEKPKTPMKKQTKKEKSAKKKIEEEIIEQKILQTKSILKKGKEVKEIKEVKESKKIESQKQEENQQIQQKPVEQTKKKAVSFEGVLPINTELQKRWKDPIQNQRKGKFDSDEEKILSEAVGKFLVANGISLEQFENLLTIGEKSDKFSKKQKIFSVFSTALPNRSPESCYKFLKRNFNSLNRKGKWTEQQVDKLKILVEKYGRKWTLISKQLKRSSDNCYDKYRELGDENSEERVKGIWLFTEVVELLQLIEKMTKIKFLDKAIDQQLSRADFHDSVEKEEVMSRKYNSKNFIFHNNSIVKPFINAKNFQKIDISQIRWNEISTYLKTRNIHDCRNKILQLLQIFFHSESKQLEQKIVDFLILNKYQNQHEINWKDWKSKDATSQEAKNRFMIMKKMVEGRSVKPFKTVILELKQRVQKKLKQKSLSKAKKSHIVIQDISEE